MKKKTLITFVYFERKSSSIYTQNLNFFQKIGVIENEDYHYNFVVNSKTGIENIIQGKNVSAIQGHNKGYDFGAYKQSLESVDINNYDYFIFMNDTCRGPFISDYIQRENTWVDMFVDKLDDEVKMVGPTWFNATKYKYFQRKFGIKVGEFTHIQSYCFGIDKHTLNLLLNNNRFDTYNKNRKQIIKDHEIGNSQFLIKNGYKIEPFQISKYDNIENGNIYEGNGGYFGANANPFELMFIKTNMFVDSIVDKYTKWILLKC